MMAPVVNAHTHYQPASIFEALGDYGITLQRKSDGSTSINFSGRESAMPAAGGWGTGADNRFWSQSVDRHLAEMDEHRIDIHVLQPSPRIFNYDLEPETNLAFAKAYNDQLAAHIQAHPDRFWGSALLPMQDLELAAVELRRAVEDLGMAACTVGYVLGPDLTLADPPCEAFLSVVEELNIPLLLHPGGLDNDLDAEGGKALWLRKYHVDWSWGYLFTETAAVLGFIFGGALDRHPNLRVMVPHGGGMIPYQVGRMAYQAKMLPSEGKAQLPRTPEQYLGRFFFDTAVHDPRALRLLVEVMGDDNVVLGTNYPGWDNAPIWDLLRADPSLSAETKQKVLGANAAERLFASPRPLS
jgi:aminocarboxymuconate-semialdehyde decarboxylase